MDGSCSFLDALCSFLEGPCAACQPPHPPTDHGGVKQGKSCGSAGTARNCVGTTGVRDGSGGRPIGTANSRQQNTTASCHTPPPHCPLVHCDLWGRVERTRTEDGPVHAGRAGTGLHAWMHSVHVYPCFRCPTACKPPRAMGGTRAGETTEQAALLRWQAGAPLCSGAA